MMYLSLCAACHDAIGSMQIWLSSEKRSFQSMQYEVLCDEEKQKRVLARSNALVDWNWDHSKRDRS